MVWRTSSPGKARLTQVFALLVCILLPEHISLLHVPAAEVAGAPLQQDRVQVLELELQAVKQQLAVLLGAAAVVPSPHALNDSGDLKSIVDQSLDAIEASFKQTKAVFGALAFST